MENPFKKIIQSEKLPETLRSKVMDDVAMIKLSLDMADLVAVKYPATLGEFLGLRDKKKDRNQS